MSEKMTLLQVVSMLGTFDPDSEIYAAEPWTRDSLAIVARGTEDGRTLPPEAARLKLIYFHQVDASLQFLEGLESSVPEACDRLIHFATHDA
jgi:hypothetical protein